MDTNRVWTERNRALTMMGLAVVMIATFFISLPWTMHAFGQSSTPSRANAGALAPRFHPPRSQYAIPAHPEPTIGLTASVTHCAILMYHYIRVNPDPTDILGQNLSVTPPDFAAQMRYLYDQHFHVITLDQLAAHIRYGVPLPAKPVVISFDDGYADQYWKALPILERFGFKATFFIVADFVGQPRYMNWRQVSTLNALGMDIGAHTLHHPELPSIPSGQARQEIFQSKHILESRLGHPVDVFAYPSGAFNQQIIHDVRQAGYIAAVSTLLGDMHSRRTIDYLYRVRVLDTTTPQALAAEILARWGDPYAWVAHVP